MNVTVSRGAGNKPEKLILASNYEKTAKPASIPKKDNRGFIEKIPSYLSKTADWLGEGTTASFSDPGIKEAAIGGSNLLTGAIGSIPAFASALAGGGKLVAEKTMPEFEGLQRLLGGVSDVANYATPEALQGYLNKLSGGYLEPETGLQKGIAEFSSDAGSIAGFPGAGGIKTGLKLATAGNIAGKTAEYMGAGEGTKSVAKALAMFGAGMWKPGTASKVKSAAYKTVDKIATPRVKLDSKNIEKAAKELIKKASTGDASWKNELIGNAEKALSKIKKGKMSLEEVWATKKDLGKSLRKGDPEKLVNGYDFLNSFEDSLQEYGKINKSFGSAYNNANILNSIEHAEPVIEKAMSTITKHLEGKVPDAFKKLINRFIIVGIGKLTGVGGTTSLIVKEAIESLYKTGTKLIKSPMYREAAVNLAKQATKGSVPATAKAIREVLDLTGNHLGTKENKLNYTITRK